MDLLETLKTVLSDMWLHSLTYVIFVLRLILPALAIAVVWRCARSLLSDKNEPEIWGYLVGGGMSTPLTHWENIIGRGNRSDVLINLPTVSRNHAALIRDDKGKWTLYDLTGKGGTLVNGQEMPGHSQILAKDDIITLGGLDLVLTTEIDESAQSRTKPGKYINPGHTLTYLSIFAVLLSFELCISLGKEAAPVILAAFFGHILLMWLGYGFIRSLRRSGYEVETIAFFLCFLGLSVTASSDVDALFKQCIATYLGMAGFLILGWVLRDLDRVKKLRWPMAAFAVCLLVGTIIFGSVLYGARNWIIIGGFSIQPSELVKVAFVFAGAATLDRLFAKRNLFSLIIFSAICLGALAFMGDFGTALIFFVVFLVISFMRSGDIATIALSCAGAGFAGLLALSVNPYILNRFAAWGHVWEYASSTGYQQTRTMSAAASGGLFGMGAGEGWLKDIVAADTDLVFGVLCEELGLIVALCAILSIVLISLFAIKAAYNGRSAYYITAACAVSALFVFQSMLNVFGSVDILPLTGVTFPFVSNGGSSMIASWCLLAFIKAADTRQNASFAIRLPRRRKAVTYE